MRDIPPVSYTHLDVYKRQDNTAGQNLMRYSTANSPYGPWKEGGIVLEGTGCDTTHGSITEYKGHWYLFYHNCEISGNGTLRSVCIDEVKFNSDGSIQTVQPVSYTHLLH